MSALFCLGLGYSAAVYIARYGGQFDRIAGTVRTSDKAARVTAQGLGERRIDAILFNERDKVSPAIESADLVIASIPPEVAGDPALALYANALRDATRLKEIVYLSTIGVYGDHAGAWVDETTPANPVSSRSRERLQAEQQWQDFGRRNDIPVAIFRLPGIYGPGRNALINVARGEAKRIVKPGQVFNRIHVHDIAQAIDAAHVRRANGIFNICDDEPAPAQDPVTYAANLLGMAPPPEMQFDDIKDSMSPMALSFYAESKRARNTRMKNELGVALAYPSYREGLRALYDAGDATVL